MEAAKDGICDRILRFLARDLTYRQERSLLYAALIANFFVAVAFAKYGSILAAAITGYGYLISIYAKEHYPKQGCKGVLKYAGAGFIVVAGLAALSYALWLIEVAPLIRA